MTTTSPTTGTQRAKARHEEHLLAEGNRCRFLPPDTITRQHSRSLSRMPAKPYWTHWRL